MRPSRRLAVSTAALSGAVFLTGPALLIAPASAETVTAACPTYPFDCKPPGGGSGTPSVDTPIDSSGGTAVDNPSSLPFTGGELTLIALVGAAAVSGGAALLTAGRKRSAA